MIKNYLRMALLFCTLFAFSIGTLAGETKTPPQTTTKTVLVIMPACYSMVTGPAEMQSVTETTPKGKGTEKTKSKDGKTPQVTDKDSEKNKQTTKDAAKVAAKDSAEGEQEFTQPIKIAPQPANIKGTGIKGIYVTQTSLENTAFLNYLIKRAKAAGIDTFVVDLEKPSKRYESNIALLKDNDIKYVARIIMFPEGGNKKVIKDPDAWQKKYSLVKQAVNWGASQIQLDYIRYSSKEKASSENSKDIMEIIQWYKGKLAEDNIPLQIDVFGITSFGESKHIGQNIKLFSQTVDAICPMVYPSHYVPFADHFQRPYETVYDSLRRIKKQFGDEEAPMKIYAYIELSNYHYPMSRPKTLEYIKAQIKAVEAAGVEGWYAWSPHNRYDNLFSILEDLKNS